MPNSTIMQMLQTPELDAEKKRIADAAKQAAILEQQKIAQEKASKKPFVPSVNVKPTTTTVYDGDIPGDGNANHLRNYEENLKKIANVPPSDTIPNNLTLDNPQPSNVIPLQSVLDPKAEYFKALEGQSVNPVVPPVPPAQATSVQDQLAKMFYQEPINPAEKIKKMGILDQAELNLQYNKDLEERNSFARNSVGGQAAGTVVGALLSKLLGGKNYSSSQAIETAIPSLAGVSSAVGIANKAQDNADKDYPTALKTYFNALTHFDDKNDAIAKHNKDVDLKIYELQHKGIEPHLDNFTDSKGREYKIIRDSRTGQEISRQFVGKTGHNLDSDRISKIDNSLQGLKTMLKTYEDKLSTEAVKQSALGSMISTLAANGDTDAINKIGKIQETAKNESELLRGLKQMIGMKEKESIESKIAYNQDVDEKDKMSLPSSAENWKNTDPDSWSKSPFNKPSESGLGQKNNSTGNKKGGF